MIPNLPPILLRLRRLMLPLVFSLAAPAFAGPGHDGGHEGDETQTMATDPALPRFEAHSDLFEVVGTVNRGEISVTLDTWATNEPVAGAQIELESGSYKANGEFQRDDGSYRFKSAPFGETGSYPITLTISTGNDVDLLAASLVVPQALGTSVATGTPRTSGPDRRVWWGIGGLAAVLALAFGLRSRRRAA
ncbi:hypothetical protein [Aromatoleum evansii]|uniref:hypothetical protein n=1 Tax=Aromatoleum evansii TaxID=59406 RepID=UPI00145C6843|nr:hypothetical protein [Aromatoleum evansii]NMG29984.1 hypothetical protein [Aromatoleum evansii]